jgi:hypothetical protein
MSVKSPAGCTLFLTILLSPASADIMPCVSGSLSTIDGSTCDIGNLQFTFTGFNREEPSDILWTDSDFTFSVLSNGFELSGPPPQILTPTNSPEVDSAELLFNVTDLDLNGFINGLGISGGELAAFGGSSGNGSLADNFLTLCSGSSCLSASNTIVNFGGGNIVDELGVISGSALLKSGAGGAEPFFVAADSGATASIDDTATDFTFTTTTFVPEPRLTMLLSVGLLGLAATARRKLRR